ncbi:MAG: 3-oxoacyl-(acyl-carrier-protein) synthase, partial [Myxococcota bacterium]
MFFADSTVIGITPFQAPDARLAVALCRAGVVGVIDLGLDREAAIDAVHVASKYTETFGIRVPVGCDFAAECLTDQVGMVVLATPGQLAELRGVLGSRHLLVQVRSIQEAEAAVEADGLIAVGNESGGLVDDESTFVLLQRLAVVEKPVWAQGGIGLHTAAAAIAGGAAGVVLDDQLALVREASTPADLRHAITAMDGSETTVIAGHRVYTRPDLPLDQTLDAISVGRRLGNRLGTDLVPVGQGAAVATVLASRFRTAGGVAHALTESIRRHLEIARAEQPLRTGGALAEEHGTEFSIAQGPMTRVSDRAAFAEGVANAGALPFLALALLRGPRVEALLKETADRLGDQAWGVGLLGFVPPELREEQLEVIRRYKPPFALIAGGRPSQARPLEADGTRVYLHVPSPGLLDLYLKDGARRFVFEGRECGGHVGPRSSFALWEAQIERLLAFDDPASLSILFAGGIHDGRSAAMVSAMTAELAAQGARVGVLMGTAYLFTEEAVSSGAILKGFQEEAQRCERTSLLETAPGHATRCVETDYVRAFRAEKTRLEGEGLSSQEVWAALEELNLGRLRIASKGLRRDGAELVEVDEAEQHQDGMYMIGQVAALRNARCTARELHVEVSDGSVAQLGTRAPTLPEPPKPEPADIAIVGMACIFPDAPDLQTFWSNIVAGKNAITEVPPDRWNPEIYFDPESNDGTKTPSKWGGFLPTIAFDPLAYGIPPRSLAAIEPVQLLALEVAARTLRDAGYEGREVSHRRTSVIFGAEAGTELAGGYGFRAFFPQLIGDLPQELDDHLPKLTEDSFPGVLANVISGRIANRLDFGGCNYTVDAACASSLTAVDLAVKELTSKTSDLVIAGGADLHNSINDYLLFASVHALSRKGQCSTFDAEADGIVLGEGVAALALKRRVDAERDGDRIYAVIQGVAGSSDGKSLGLTAPRKEGQMRALERAYTRAGISPAEVGLVEAHGTGT